MEQTPIELNRADDAISIKWSDGFEQLIPLRLLRDSCPCARCLESKSSPDSDNASPSLTANPLQVLPVETTQPLSISAMHPVGNYAYNIEFSDGHNTGIYTFQLLRNLAES